MRSEQRTAQTAHAASTRLADAQATQLDRPTAPASGSARRPLAQRQPCSRRDHQPRARPRREPGRGSARQPQHSAQSRTATRESPSADDAHPGHATPATAHPALHPPPRHDHATPSGNRPAAKADNADRARRTPAHRPRTPTPPAHHPRAHPDLRARHHQAARTHEISLPNGRPTAFPATNRMIAILPTLHNTKKRLGNTVP